MAVSTNGNDRWGTFSYSTYTLVLTFSQTGTVNWEIGIASAMSMIFAAFVIVLTIISK